MLHIRNNKFNLFGGGAFNGNFSCNSVNKRWKNETSQWVGSNNLCEICHISFLFK